MRVVNLLLLLITYSHGIFALEKLSPEIKKCYQKHFYFKKALDDFLKNNENTFCLAYWAATNHRQEFLTELIEKDMITPSACKNFLVYLVEFKCYPDIIELFLKKGIDINTQDHHGYGPLHQTNLTPDIAQLLITYGADINALSISRYTPLGHAITHNNKELVNFFLEHNAKINYNKSKPIEQSPIAHLIGCGIFPSDIDPKDRELILDLLIKAGTVIRSQHIAYLERSFKNVEPMKKVATPWYLPKYLESIEQLMQFKKVLKRKQKDQKRKKRVDKLHAFIKPFKTKYKKYKSSSLKPVDIMQWQEFKNPLLIATARAPKLKELITT